MKKTVTIGIPTYQSEENIVKLLTSLLKQKQQRIIIKKILVYIDGSTDRTAAFARSLNNRKIQIINSRKNRGFAYALQYLMRRNTSDIFVGINDDIKIESDRVIEALATPLCKNKKVGLVGGNIKALKPKSFIGRSIHTSYLVFEELRYKINNGKSDLTCDGKILALSSAFANTLNLKRAGVGNVDMYLYYENLRQGREYAFAKKALIYYRLPETIEDFQNQEDRAKLTRKLIKDQYYSLYTINHFVPKTILFKSLFKVFLKYPLETIIFKFYIKSFSAASDKFNSRWKLALSTKKLGILLADFERFLSSL